VYIPLIDEEIEVSYRIKEEIPNLLIIVPEERFCDIVLNKWNMYKEFVKNGLHVPETLLLENIDSIDCEWPMIVKPIVGRGSRGVQILHSKKQLEAYLELSSYKLEDLILQRLLQGIEYTVSVIVSRQGKLLAVVPKRVIRKKGVTQVAVTEENYAIESLCKDIQSKLKANGPFNVQLIMEGNKPFIIEINPRFSTTVALTLAAGVNEVDIAIKDSLGIPYTIDQFKKGVVMTRYYEQYYIAESEVKL
jgi:carbamoyl-phosphate synthase large subunit